MVTCVSGSFGCSNISSELLTIPVVGSRDFLIVLSMIFRQLFVNVQNIDTILKKFTNSYLQSLFS